MPLLRTSVSELGRKEGKDTIEIAVRAGSKPGAIITARLSAAQFVPFREQNITRVENRGNDRFLDKWVVEVQDSEGLSALGR